MPVPEGSMARFREEFPDRFYNAGVAEGTMIGICAGLALRGCKPFSYTIATFTIYGPFEQVRDDLCYQNLPVTLVGIGGGRHIRRWEGRTMHRRILPL